MALTEVSLTPELERFAEACVASGAYESVSAVAQAAFRHSVFDAEAEAERDGWISGEEAMAGFLALADEIEAEAR